MRRFVTWRLVLIVSLAILVSCVVWAIAVQYLVPDACTYRPPPENAQFLHCP